MSILNAQGCSKKSRIEGAQEPLDQLHGSKYPPRVQEAQKPLVKWDGPKYLPRVIVRMFATFLDFPTLCRFGLVSKQCNEITNSFDADLIFWKNLHTFHCSTLPRVSKGSDCESSRAYKAAVFAEIHFQRNIGGRKNPHVSLSTRPEYPYNFQNVHPFHHQTVLIPHPTFTSFDLKTRVDVLGYADDSISITNLNPSISDFFMPREHIKDSCLHPTLPHLIFSSQKWSDELAPIQKTTIEVWDLEKREMITALSLRDTLAYAQHYPLAVSSQRRLIAIHTTDKQLFSSRPDKILIWGLC